MTPSGMTRCIGEQVGKMISDIVEVDVDDNGIGWGPYYRVRVQLDIIKPLLRGSLVNIEGNKTWLTFKYERLPNFYFKCGIIKHRESVCLKASLAVTLHDRDQNQYGAWV